MGLESQADSHSAIQNGGGSPEALNLLETTLKSIKLSSRLGTVPPTSRPSSPGKSNVILPEEIWKKIISYLVDSPSTLCALALTCRAMSSLSLPILWHRVSVGLKNRRCPTKSSYIDATATQITTSGLIKHPALPFLTAELRSWTHIMDFYFDCFKWALNIFEQEHRYVGLFVNVKIVRLHLDSLSGPMFSSGVPHQWRIEGTFKGQYTSSYPDAFLYYENYADGLPACDKVVYLGPSDNDCYNKWHAAWDDRTLRERAPKKLVVVLTNDSHHIDFKHNSMTRCASSLCDIRNLHDIVVIFYQGKDRHKHLSKIMDSPWRHIRKHFVYFLKRARERHPWTRVTLVNTECFEARWLGFSEPLKGQLLQQKVKEELKTEGLSRWGMKLFERFPEHVTHTDEDEDIDRTEARELNAGKEKERLLSMSEYLQTEDWEGELEESEVKQWLDESS
ncbi:hypothetical protein L204_105048 [Cryptococcus depauperatus]|nr:hypothetical protein L204_03696 [Cryptococcus depauperatus CBS 7855]